MANRYHARRILGQSRRSRVLLADGPDGPVVVKVARDGADLSAQRDAHRAARHPGLAPCLDADPDGSWFVLPWYPNGAVDLWARGQPLAQAIDAAARIGDALAHLHAEGRLHGDLKPANVLVDANQNPVLVDLGDAGSGTPGWRAPELEAGRPADPAADVYSLAAVCYAMFARRPPFPDPRGDGRIRVPEPPSSARPRLPAAIEELVLGGLHPDPAARPGAAAFAAGLRAGRDGDPVARLVVGMTRERESLRRAVLDVRGGTPRVVVIYGAEGSGRRTLIAEALATAERLGLARLHHAPGSGDPPGPAAIALDGTTEGAADAATRIAQAGWPLLVLIHAPRPLPGLTRVGAWHLKPPPLGAEEVALVLEHHRRDRRTADDLQRRSRGHAGSVAHLLGAVDAIPSADATTAAVLELLRAGPVPVPALATRAGLSEHHLLDVVDPLLDAGIVASSPDGFTLSLARNVGPGHPAGDPDQRGPASR